MNANIFLSSCSSRSLCLWASLSLLTTAISAQTPTSHSAIRGAKTDNNYSNTTEVSKAKNATDEQVLSQIEGNYGLGDVVRIVITTPKPTTEPLGRSTNGKPSSINVSPVPIPMGQLTPNNNLPTPQQGKADDYAQPAKLDNYDLRNSAKPAKADNYALPKKSDDYNLRNNATPTKSDDYAQPKKADDYNLRSDATPTKSDDYNLPNGAKSSKADDYARPNGTKPYNTGGQFTTPSNRPTPQKAMTPAKYDENGRPIQPKSNYTTTQWTPIANKPAPQQTTTPPQYKSNPQPPTSTVAFKTPNGNSSTMTASTDKVDLSTFFGDKKDKTVVSQEIMTNKLVETPVREQQNQTERNIYTPSGRSEKASGASSSSGSSSRSSKSAKSSGFSLKNLFSFGTSGSKMPKRQPVKSSKKYGCYRFN